MESTSLICMPTFNEEENVYKMITDLKKLNIPIILNDGYSTDRTVDIAKKLNTKVTFRSKKKAGKSIGVQDAVKYASENNYTFLILIDCDGTYPVTKIPELLKEIKHYDMIVGKRDYSQIPLLRKAGNYAMNLTVNVLYMSKMRDIASGLRVIRVNSFIGKLKSTGFNIEPELTCISLQNKLNIKEIPIPYFQRKKGKSKTDLRHLFQIIYFILKFKFIK